MQLTFHGVRGSCPCPSEANQRYGGNTACVVLEDGDEEPIVFDLGTGLRRWWSEAALPMDGTFAATALVTHIHWDHVQGLPFFPPLHLPGSRLDVYGPNQDEGPLGEVFDGLMRPPYFPVRVRDLASDIRFHGVTDDAFAIGAHKVKVRPVPHVGATVGYRVEGNGRSVAYVSDHQAPPSLDAVADEVLELAEGVDLLVHDAQFTPAEFAQKSDWGHCTLEYALHVAREAGAQGLVLFHHDPAHGDDQMDALGAEVRRLAKGTGVEVVTAYEGLVLPV